MIEIIKETLFLTSSILGVKLLYWQVKKTRLEVKLKEIELSEASKGG